MSAAPTRSYTPPWGLRALAHLPVPVFRAAGWLMGLGLMLLVPGRRRVVQRNLALCFPQASAWQRWRWTWQTFCHFSQSFMDRVWLWHGAPERVRQRVEIRDPHGVLRQTTALICFAPHFYGLDAAWTALTLTKPRLWLTLYAPQGSQMLDRWIYAGRRRFGEPLLVSRRDGFRPLLKGLRQGATLCLLPDMDVGARNSVFVPFFGVSAATVTTLPRLAQGASTPVVTVVCRMVAGGYVVEMGPHWADYPSGDELADARRMNAELEQLIVAMPGQYHWLHRRFKTRPAGEPELYRD